MTSSRVEQAARNNAVWCETVCRVHGTPGEFHDTLWLNRHPVPRFYPNVVTLATHDGTATQLANIQELVATGLPGRWGVKDSFCALDLAALGFQPLFEAAWLWRTPFQPLPNRAASGLHWTWVQSTPELAKWETAWSASPANNLSPQQPRLFLPALLANPELVFIVAYQGQELVAGAIAHHTDDVVGLSNVFVPPEHPVAFWAGCVAMVQERFPDVPMVGYEHGSELAIAQEIGFEMLHPLKVWTRYA
jgi:hypothetical protein